MERTGRARTTVVLLAILGTLVATLSGQGPGSERH